VLFGGAGISAKDAAERLVSQVLHRLGADAQPPCVGDPKTIWTLTVKAVLQEMGTSLKYTNFCEWCLIDFIWWSMPTQRLILAAESEMAKSPDAVETDFEKLSVFKCPLKLLVFSADVDRVKENAEGYLQLFAQHVEGEEYLLVGFTASGPRCFLFKVPHDGKLDKAEFNEFQLSRTVLAA
jgi:hypothetical protein